MTHWRIEARWYATALAIMPLLVLAMLLALAFFISPAFAPTLSLFGLSGLAAGFFEEIGWTGFAVARLRSRWGLLAVGLGVGVLWVSGAARSASSAAARRAFAKEKILSCLVLHKDQVLLEYYRNNKLQHALQKVNSCTKSVVSALVGIALDRDSFPVSIRRLPITSPIYSWPKQITGSETLRFITC